MILPPAYVKVYRQWRRWALVALSMAAGIPVRAAEREPRPKEVVILLHGIMNKAFVMDRLVGVLEKDGYEVHNWGYPSTANRIEDHAKKLREFVRSLGDDRRIHFVGFSQGAIIIRYMLTHEPVPNAGRFVMIAPPNHGCEMARDFYKYPWFRGLYGDQSIKQLFARQNEFLEKCGKPSLPFGIIAGGKGDAKGFSTRIPGDDDGTISVASASLEGAKDLIVLRHQHTPLVFAADTAMQTAYFLRHESFLRKNENAKP